MFLRNTLERVWLDVEVLVVHKLLDIFLLDVGFSGHFFLGRLESLK